jgi:hypothetical protein
MDQLVNDLVGITLHPTPHISVWRWPVSEKYFVHSKYEWLDFDGL